MVKPTPVTAAANARRILFLLMITPLLKTGGLNEISVRLLTRVEETIDQARQIELFDFKRRLCNTFSGEERMRHDSLRDGSTDEYRLATRAMNVKR